MSDTSINDLSMPMTLGGLYCYPSWLDADRRIDNPILNLSAEEKRVFTYLFNLADTDKLGVVTGERAVGFFERTKVSPNVLGEVEHLHRKQTYAVADSPLQIWQLADTENRGLLTKPGFSVVLRLIGHYQAGREPTAELAFKRKKCLVEPVWIVADKNRSRAVTEVRRPSDARCCRFSDDWCFPSKCTAASDVWRPNPGASTTAGQGRAILRSLRALRCTERPPRRCYGESHL